MEATWLYFHNQSIYLENYCSTSYAFGMKMEGYNCVETAWPCTFRSTLNDSGSFGRPAYWAPPTQSWSHMVHLCDSGPNEKCQVAWGFSRTHACRLCSLFTPLLVNQSTVHSSLCVEPVNRTVGKNHYPLAVTLVHVDRYLSCSVHHIALWGRTLSYAVQPTNASW